VGGWVGVSKKKKKKSVDGSEAAAATVEADGAWMLVR
jgi:hypothetical protein